jgi:hypothetical protein
MADAIRAGAPQFGIMKKSNLESVVVNKKRCGE